MYLYLHLLAPDANHSLLFFTLPPASRHSLAFLDLLGAERWRNKDSGYIYFCLLTPPPLPVAAYVSFNTVLTSPSGQTTNGRYGGRRKQTQKNQRRTSGVRGGVEGSTCGKEATLLSAMKQKCLQITNRIVSLGVNQHRTRLCPCFL